MKLTTNLVWELHAEKTLHRHLFDSTKVSARDDSGSVDKVELLIRWRSIFLNLAAPSTALCRRMCVACDIEQKLHGTGKEDLIGFDLVAWSQSSNALRAVLHVLAIQDMVERMPLRCSHAIHPPRRYFLCRQSTVRDVSEGSTPSLLPEESIGKVFGK